MLRRFVSAVVVAAVGVACASVIVYFAMPEVARNGLYSVLLVWLCVPTVWGIWAMLAPKSWVPQRLPSWGAALGVLAAIGAVFIMDVPARMTGAAISFRMRSLAVLAVVVFYYLLWMIVRAVWASLSAPGTEEIARSKGAHAA